MSSERKHYLGTDTAPDPNNMQCFMLNHNTNLFLLKGNIVRWHGDVIVNAGVSVFVQLFLIANILLPANEAMLGGGGVDGAIHAAAGPAFLEACRKQPELRPGVRCPTGEARLTE